LAFVPTGAGVGGGLDNCCGSGLTREAAPRVAAERVTLGAILEIGIWRRPSAGTNDEDLNCET